MPDRPILDAHAHVWDRSCRLVPGARYHPDYEATIDTYLRLLDMHGVERAVLVQPSFLGTDNRYLLECLSRHPDRLRGIVVVPSSISGGELDDLVAMGVIGVRLNLIGHDPASMTTPGVTQHVRALAERNLWVEVQAHGADWPMLLEVLLGESARVMVDHFGKPGGNACPGHHALLRADPARLSVKLSAPYRQSPADITPFARRLIDHVGAGRCLWGSDWPWTQNEGRHDYAATQSWLDAWTTQAERRIMTGAAPLLTGFATDMRI